MNAVILQKKKLNQKVLSIAMPAFLTMITHTVVMVTDTAMVGRLGKEAVAAAGLGGLAFTTFLSLFFGGALGIQILTAHRYGEKNYIKAAEILFTATVFLLILAVFVSILGWYYSDFIIKIFAEDQTIIRLASDYFKYRMIGLCGFAILFALRGFFDGLGLTYIGMFSALATTGANVFLNWIFIFGNFGSEAYGLSGAAVASSFAALPGILVFILYLLGKKMQTLFPISSFHFNTSVVKEVLLIGLPTLLDNILLYIAFLFYYKISGKIGVESIAATNIVITIISISFMPGFAFGVAATTLTGQFIGEKKSSRVKSAVFSSVLFASVFMGLLGFIFIIFANKIIGVFTNEPTVFSEAYGPLVLISFFQVADAFHMIYASALRGAGYVYWVLKAYFIVSYFIMLPVSYLLAILLHLGTMGLWMGMCLWLIILSLSFFVKFQKGEWKTYRTQAIL